MVKKIDFKAMRKRTSKAVKGMSEKDREHEEKEDNIQQQSVTFPLNDLKARPGGDTRSLHLEHVVSLAESISALGLLEPIVIDKSGYLLAGGHRLAACRLLEATPKKRKKILEELKGDSSRTLPEELSERVDALHWPGSKEELRLIPVRIMDFDANDDVDLALAIEAAENTQRKDYTAKEVFALYEKLISAGYTNKRGKPKEGERAAKPAIALVIGKSIRTVERMLLKAQEKESEVRQVQEVQKTFKGLSKAIEKFSKACEELEDSESTKKLIAYLSAPKLQKLVKAVVKESLSDSPNSSM
ncbi:MAG: hypothetical protein CL920_10190 [Deltaproteobacteria bacterium]|nr:hypothetical protein [Deltaproteobacteria bacterium]